MYPSCRDLEEGITMDSYAYIITTFLDGTKEPIITYSNDVKPGLYMAEGMVMCIKENPEWRLAPSTI